MTVLAACRFFVAMRLHPDYGLVLSVACVGVGIVAMVSTPAAGLEDCVGVLVYVQMFLASTGFSLRAHRGHFDPLLVAVSRRRVLLTHWAVSTAPGAVCWLLLLVTGLLRGVASASFLLYTAAAMLIVSLLSWSAGFTAARGTAGVIWTMGLLVALFERVDFVSSASPLALAACPFALIRASGLPPARAAAAVALASIPFVVILVRAPGVSVCLEERA